MYIYKVVTPQQYIYMYLGTLKKLYGICHTLPNTSFKEAFF